MAAFNTGSVKARGLLAGWSGLGRFWGVVLTALVIGVVVLQVLGPPTPSRRESQTVEPPHARPAAPPPAHIAAAEPHSNQPPHPGRTTPGPIPDPDPGLLEPVAGAPSRFLPRISVDGRAPMSEYAAAFDPTTLRPRVSLVVGGIGMSEADSLAAIKNLPGAVTLAITAYAPDSARLLSAARLNEHEYLLSVPMEPQGYPINDPDDRTALMTGQPPAENLSRLQALLARLTGYVGVTNAVGPMRGERFSGLAVQFDPVLEAIAQRGLLFVDARVGQIPLPYVWNRSADLVLDDEPLDAAQLDKRLDELTRLALDKGAALGLVSLPRPVTVDRIVAWTNNLFAKGLVLAPASALMLPPAKREDEK